MNNKDKMSLCDCDIVHTDAVKNAAASMPNIAEIQTVSEIFKVLGDPTRMKMMWALKLSELCVCDLAATLGMTKSAISHQLSTLKQAKMVKCRREGKNVYYSLDDDHVTNIIMLAMEHTKHK